jgi:hypothetical protein
MSDQNVFRFWTSDWSGKQWADCDTYVDAVERILQDALDDLSELNEKFKIEAEAMKEFDKAFDAVKQQGAYYDDVECTGMREPFSMMYYEDDDQA